MQTLETIKSRSQETWNTLLEKGKEQPDDVKRWGVTAGGAIVGAVIVPAVAKGVVAILATLTAPPIALTVGAVGGGVLGWNWMQESTAASANAPAAPASGAPAVEAAAI